MANIMKDMTIAQYANAIAEAIGGKSTPVEKANGVIFYGIIKPMKGSNISPTVYVEDWYKRDVSIDEAAKEIEAIINKNQKENFDLDNINNFEKVKPMLQARLYNKATKAEVFRNAKDFEDLIIIPYIELGDIGDGSRGYIKVTDQMVNLWGVTKRTVIDTAVKNTKGKIIIEDMQEMLIRMLIEQGYPEEFVRDMYGENNTSMYVITNRDKYYGAIQAVLDRETLKKKFPNGYTIIPSSIHEMILIPDTNPDEECLRGIIEEVNTYEVKPEEILGAKPYIFTFAA